MKKFIIILFFALTSIEQGFCQGFPGYPVESITYDNMAAMNKQILVQDSSLFLIKHQGLEEINTNDFTTKSRWQGFYPLNRIVADTSSTIVYLKSYNFLGRFNPVFGNYENIWPDAYMNKYINDIDVDQDGQVWTVSSGTVNEIGILNGDEWQLYSTAGFTYLNSIGIRAINNNSAIISAGALFFRFQEGNFDTLYFDENLFSLDWDADPDGNLWIASGQRLIHVSDQNVIVYDSSNSPIGEDEFLHVILGTNGHTWVAGNTKNVYEFDGSNWFVHQFALYFPEIENLALDEENKPWIITHNYEVRKVYEPAENSWNDHIIPFMPVKNPKAIGIKTGYSYNGFFANDDGYFTVNFQSLSGFKDSTNAAYANEITCFTENDPYEFYNPVYGTHHGVFGIADFDNNQLPSLNINYICYYSGTYYIATDSGLTTFNGIFYNHYNMSNTPLPSNKITFVTTNYTNCFWGGNENSLYVGTDKGLAFYQNFEWIVYDTTNIDVDNFFVTGISPNCYDYNETFVATQGNGLIRIFSDGDYELYNTEIGNFADDSLYYVKFMSLMECGEFIVIGTRHHGIGYAEMWNSYDFEFDTQYEFSKAVAIGNYYNMNILSTDQSYMILTPCGSVPNSIQKEQLAWYCQSDNLIVTVPSEFSGNSYIEMADITGRVVCAYQLDISDEKISMDITHFSGGIYIFSIFNGNKRANCKVLLLK